MMRSHTRPLAQKLALFVVIKLLVLALIWWLWIEGRAVPVDDTQAASHLLGASAAPKE